MNKGLIFGGIALGVILFIVIGLASCSSTKSEGVRMEQALNAQYLDNQNELSSYTTTFYETIGVANLKSDKMNKILVEAVKGRYEGHTSAQPGQGQLFSAITEAYPNLDLKLYDDIVKLIKSGREAYKQKQSKLLDMLRAYDTWRNDGLFHPSIVRFLGFPSQNLEARIGTTVKRGEEARNQMYLIVLTDSTVDAYQTGRQNPLPIPGATPEKK